MKIFSAILDVALIPVALAEDIIMAPIKVMDPFNNKEFLDKTRKQVEKADEDLED